MLIKYSGEKNKIFAFGSILEGTGTRTFFNTRNNLRHAANFVQRNAFLLLLILQRVLQIHVAH